MIKKQIGLLTLSFFYVAAAGAQILNIEKLSPTLNLSADFLDALETCTDHKSERSAFSEGSETKITYEIEKKDNNTCALQIVGQTDHYVHIEQNCLLPMEKAREYATTLRQFNAKRYSLFKDTFAINKDENYIAAAAIMQNPDFCRFKRLEIDNTKEIRENLPACKRTKNEELVENAKISREIAGRDENFNCKYYYTLWRPETQIEKKPFANVRNMFIPSNEMNFRYACSFNEVQKKEYLMLLESLVLPEEEGYNFTAVSTFSSKIELEFIIKHCEYVPNKKNKKN